MRIYSLCAYIQSLLPPLYLSVDASTHPTVSSSHPPIQPQSTFLLTCPPTNQFTHHPAIHLFIFPLAHLPIHLAIHLFIHKSTHPSIHPLVYLLSTHTSSHPPSTHPTTHPSIGSPTIHPAIFLSILHHSVSSCSNFIDCAFLFCCFKKCPK